MNKEDKQLNDAAELYNLQDVYFKSTNKTVAFKDGAKSDAAKKYWYAQFQLEQKQQSADDISDKTYTGKGEGSYGTSAEGNVKHI